MNENTIRLEANFVNAKSVALDITITGPARLVGADYAVTTGAGGDVMRSQIRGAYVEADDVAEFDRKVEWNWIGTAILGSARQLRRIEDRGGGTYRFYL